MVFNRAAGGKFAKREEAPDTSYESDSDTTAGFGQAVTANDMADAQAAPAGGAAEILEAAQLVLPAIETVDLTEVKHERKATALKRAHLLSMEPGQSIGIEKRSQWATLVRDMNTGGSAEWKFYTVQSGVRLARVS